MTALMKYDTRKHVSKPFETQFVTRPRPTADEDQLVIRASSGEVQRKSFKKLGLGAKPDMDRLGRAESIRAGVGQFAETVVAAKGCPVWNMPVIEQVQWTLAGPITHFATLKTFGAQIDLLGSDKSAEGVDFISTTMAQVGELQTHALICAIGFHLSPEPLCWTAQGNAVTHPDTPQPKPISPDVFTLHDVVNGALGAAFAGQTPTQFMRPAVLEWGWWANLVAWHMVRGYDFRWKIGQHTNIMDEQLRHTAYMPPNAQEGSASSSQVDILDFTRRSNDRYDSLGSAFDFLPIDFLRLGSATVGGANVGVFRPSRAFEVVGATYGGMDLRSMLNNNSEFRKLAVPYFLRAGIPIGLIAQESDSIQADLMRRFLDITQGQNGPIPPSILPAANFTGGPTIDTSPAALEMTFDSPPAFVSQQVFAERILFKGGDLKITLPIKGFEVDEDWMEALKNPTIRDAVLCECGCAWPKG